MYRFQIKKLIVLVAIFSICSMPAFSGRKLYNDGMAAYNQQQYNYAKQLFRRAIQESYYDVNSRYMLAQILIKNDKNYVQAKKEYEQIIKIAPGSQAANYSKQGLVQINKYLATASTTSKIANNSSNTANVVNKQNEKKQIQEQKPTETDYVKNAYRAGQKYIRKRGITRVYIEPNSVYKPMMQAAYDEWQAAMGSYVMFTNAGNKNDADDVVSFVTTAPKAGAMQEGGHCQYKQSGNTITGADIVIRTISPKGEPLSKAMIYHAMLHEIGHSIGIEGHSLYSGDIMSTGIRVPVAHLSQRDKNTARILYQTYKKEPTTSEIKTAKEQELKSLAAKIPNDPSSYIDLGDEYMAAGEYNKAIDSYNKALKVKKNIPTYYRLTKAYKAVHDSDNLIVTYKSILALNPADKSALSGALMVYYEQYRIKDGAELLNAFIAKNPSQTNDADILKFKAMFSPAVQKRIEANEKHLKLKER